jgi:hypothetical protein
MVMQDALTFDPQAPAVSREEGAALVVALAAHAALVAVLAFGAPGREVQPPPQRMTVTLAEETAEQSTSTNPFEAAPPDEAPVLGETMPEPQPLPQPVPQPVAQPQPRQTQPQPQPRAAAQPVRTPPPRPVAQPPKPAVKDTRDRRRPDQPVGGSRIGDDFLKGVPTGTQRAAQGNPAEAISDTAKASARQTIGAEVLPFWNRCAVDGVDIEKLAVRIVIHMDRSGRVLSMDAPEVTGRTAANAPQVNRFIECAQGAIRSASPFNLSADSYEFWKNYPVRLRKQRGQ